MTKEEQAAQEAAQAEADAQATDEEDAKETDEETEEDESKNLDIQYEAELTRERKAREDAEKAAADLSFKLREAKRNEKKGNEDDEETDDDKPVTGKQLQEVLAQNQQELQKIVSEQKIEVVAGKMSGSDAEKNLIIEIHKNRTFPSHLSIEEQLEECYLIANRKKIMGERNEAMRALRSKDGVNDNPAGSHYVAPKSSTEPKLSPDVTLVLKQSGFGWNKDARRYEKKLPNGKILIRDPKTNQVKLA